MGDEEESYEVIKGLFGHQVTYKEIEKREMDELKLRLQKKKERLRANEAAKRLRETHKLPPLDLMLEKNHTVKFKQYKLNALTCHIAGGTSVLPPPIVTAVRAPALSNAYQVYEAKKVLDVDDFAYTFLQNATMDQVRARIDKATLNIPTKAKPRMPFLKALERF